MTTVKEAGDFGSAVLKRIAALERRRGAALSKEQKILLAETGTVEQVLSIITGSAVKVRVVRQALGGDGVIRREVLIISADGRRSLVHARSKVYCKFLPMHLVRMLMQGKGGIGTIIHNTGLETCRRLIRFGLGPGGHPYRVYRIVHRGKTAFEIREDILI